MTMTCQLCPNQPPVDDILNHLRLIHPTQYGDGPEQWPDGHYIIIDQDPQPEEYQ